MRNLRIDVSCYLIVALLFLAPFSYAVGNNDTSQTKCDVNVAELQCSKNERCSKNTTQEESYCICQQGYEREEGQCVQHVTTTTVASAVTDQPDVQHESGGSSVAAGLLIPTFFIVIVLLYFAARRYQLLQRVRQRLNHYGNVLVTRDDYDDDDDPPIA